MTNSRTCAIQTIPDDCPGNSPELVSDGMNVWVWPRFSAHLKAISLIVSAASRPTNPQVKDGGSRALSFASY